MKKLSDAQVNLLAEVSNGATTETLAMIITGRSWRQTARVLEDRGLIRFHPYALDGEGAYKITADGRTTVAALLVAGRMAKL